MVNVLITFYLITNKIKITSPSMLHFPADVSLCALHLIVHYKALENTTSLDSTL